VDDKVLDPRQCWEDGEKYDKAATKLGDKNEENDEIPLIFHRIIDVM